MATQSLEFKSDLDDSQFQAGLKNMEKGGKKVEGSLVGSFNSMAKGIGASMAAAFTVDAVVGAAQATIGAVKAVLDFVGELQDQAEALGVNTEKLQGLQGAMSQSGVSAEKFTKGMATLNQNIQQAKTDTGSARDSFTALGITFADIANDSPDELILKIADGLKNAKDPAAAFAAALDLLGKNNINFVAGLKGGREEVDKLADSIEKISKEDVALLDKAGQEIDLFTKKVKVGAINGALGLSKYSSEIKFLGAAAAVATGNLGPLALIMGIIKRFTESKPGVSLPETNGAKPEVLGTEYTPSVVEDPRVKKARDEEEKRLVERGDMIRKLEAQDVKDREKHTNQMRTANEEYAKMEADSQKMADDHFEALKKTNEKKDKEAAKDALQDKIKQAGQNLEKAQKVTAKAEQKTEDARGSLQRALEGNPDAGETSKEKQTKRLMEKFEKEGKSGSIKPGVAKALKKLMEAKDAEKAAKKAEDLIKKQQEDMVKALKAIDKGINGG